MEMEFEEHYHEVLDVLEGLMMFIFNGLNERFAKEIAIVRAQYPVEEFKMPKDGKVLRLEFKEGIKMLREAGKEVEDLEDLKYVFPPTAINQPSYCFPHLILTLPLL